MTETPAIPGRLVLAAALLAWSCKGSDKSATNDSAAAAATADTADAAAPAADSGRAASGEAPPKETPYKHGRATFEYKGKQESWSLTSGKLIQSPASEGMRANTTVGLFFTRDGSEKSMSDGMLLISVSDLNLMGPGGFYVVGLGLSSSAGGPKYRPKPGDPRCPVTMKRVDAGGAEGTFTCTGTFDGGSAIGKVTFSASP